MKKLMSRACRYAAAGLLGLAVPAAVLAQQPSSPLADDGLPVTPGVIASPSSRLLQPTPSQAGSLTSAGLLPRPPVRTQPPAADATQPNPGLSSQPAPFAVTPETPAASNDANFYSGNPPVQDLSSLVAGRFQTTKYKWYGFVRVDGIYDFRPMGSTDDFVTSSIPVPQGR